MTKKSRKRKICSSGNTKVSTSLESIAGTTDGSVNRSGVLLRRRLSFPGESDGHVVGAHMRSHLRYIQSTTALCDNQVNDVIPILSPC